MDNISDKKLIRLIEKSPEEGLRLAIDLYGGAVATICRNILSDTDESDIQEAVSDCFLKLWKNVRSYKAEKGGSLKSYIYAIARNTARDKRRSLVKSSCILPIEETSIACPLDLESEYTRKANEKLIHDTIALMDEPERSVYILRYFYFYKMKDIAQKLHMTPKAIENLLYRSRKRVKKTLLERGIMYE